MTETVKVAEPCWRCGHDHVTIEDVESGLGPLVRFVCANPLCDNVTSTRSRHKAHMFWNRSSSQQRTKLGARFGKMIGPTGEKPPRPQPDGWVEEEFIDWYKDKFRRRPNLRVGSTDNRVFFAWVSGRVMERRSYGDVRVDGLTKTMEALWAIRKP